MDCFDADVLIYAAVPDHPLGRRVVGLFATTAPDERVGAGSLLLLPEVLGKPLRENKVAAVRALTEFLARLDLRPVDQASAELATALSARYRLRAADAVHLATAVSLGADRFITDNHRDFAVGITEVQVVRPADLPEP